MEPFCSCFSGKKYVNCCYPFHQGALPENALLLMRSRFSAYALNIPDYIIETTHPASSQYLENKFSWKRNISQFSNNSNFENLKIHEFKENNSIAVVSFTAYISQSGTEATFSEKSYFEIKNNRWLYLRGHFKEGETHLIETTPLKILPLAYYGNPILRKNAEPITEITPPIRKLVDEMIETMDSYKAKGLAAPQVNQSLRLFIIRKPVKISENQLGQGEIKIFINPHLSSYSPDSWEAPEGCLSIPTIQSVVERPKSVIVEYTTLEGMKVQEVLSDWEARVVMHEYDHLEGVLFIDRLKANEQTKIKTHLKKLERRIQVT